MLKRNSLILGLSTRVNAFSYTHSLIVATCPIILTAKTVDILVEKMEAAEIS